MISILSTIKNLSPTILCHTNFVTANDCANILLAIGASPTMAIDTADTKRIIPNCKALYINLGTLTKDKLRQMVRAGEVANKFSVPIILDPVGAGSSDFRQKAAKYLLRRLKISAVRGNKAEILALSSGKLCAHGVDCDIFANDDLTDIANDFSKTTNAVVVCTGENDILTDGNTTFKTYGGNPMLKKVTGAGCMLGAVISAFVSVRDEDVLSACLDAVCAMKICGNTAYNNLVQGEGNASYRNRVIDAFYHLDEKTLKERSRYVKL